VHEGRKIRTRNEEARERKNGRKVGGGLIPRHALFLDSLYILPPRSSYTFFSHDELDLSIKIKLNVFFSLGYNPLSKKHFSNVLERFLFKNNF